MKSQPSSSRSSPGQEPKTTRPASVASTGDPSTLLPAAPKLPSDNPDTLSHTGPLRVLIVEDDATLGEMLARQLATLGHSVAGTAADAQSGIDLCNELRPNLVLLDIHLPGKLDGIQAATHIANHCPTAVIFISADTEVEMAERAAATEAFGYLIKPVSIPQLQASIRLAVARFARFEEICRESADLRQALEDRKLIERAKGVLMRRKCMNEEEAYRRIRVESHHRNKKMVEIARTIMDAEDFL